MATLTTRSLSPSYRSQSRNWNTRTGANMTTMNRDSTYIEARARQRQRGLKTRRDTPKSASDLDFYEQPQRDSNPCRHLERVVS